MKLRENIGGSDEEYCCNVSWNIDFAELTVTLVKYLYFHNILTSFETWQNYEVVLASLGGKGFSKLTKRLDKKQNCSRGFVVTVKEPVMEGLELFKLF